MSECEQCHGKGLVTRSEPCPNCQHPQCRPGGYVLLAPSDMEKLRGLERYVRTTAATPHHRLCNFLGGGECDCYRAGRNYLLADWALALIEGKQA